MRCLHCATAMNEVPYEGVLIQTCEGCGGEFIGGTELAHVVSARQERFGADLQARLAEGPPRAGVRGAKLSPPGDGGHLTDFVAN